MPRADPQLSLSLPFRGGARHGAGRKRAGLEARHPHAAREPFTRSQPVHVTLRVLDHVWNLRSERCFAIVRGAFDRARRRTDFAVVHFGIEGNHLHLIVEADGPASLANGMRALGIALARGLNRLMGRTGPVFRDRYDAHVLRTPAEVRNAVAYAVGNHASHARRRGEPLPAAHVDRFSSAVERGARVGQLTLVATAATDAPASWLLRTVGRSP